MPSGRRSKPPEADSPVFFLDRSRDVSTLLQPCGIGDLLSC